MGNLIIIPCLKNLQYPQIYPLPINFEPKNLTMLASSYYIPKEDPSKPLGEDAHFINLEAQFIGVADGIGKCATRGIDAGEYARELMKNVENIIDDSIPGYMTPKEILIEAGLNTEAEGSSTACIVSIEGDILRAANLGDSGFLVIRDGKTVYESNMQSRRFNCPYQMGNLCGKQRGDGPYEAEEIEVEVRGGDVLILASDGLFDNVFVEDIELVVRNCVRERKKPDFLAWDLAQMARLMSLAGDKTPFEAEAREAGFEFSGGKYDDVTVVAAYLLSN